MHRISRQLLIGALTVIFLSSACGRLSFASPTPVWTLPPGGLPVFPTTTLPAPSTETVGALTLTPQIPITGENVVSLQCQFCVDTEAHAVLIFPESVKFDISNQTPVSCLTAAVAGGKRILICHGTQSSTFNLDICTDRSNCLQFPVALQPCPLLQAGATPLATGTPFFLTPINTLKPPKTREATPMPSTTPGSGGPSATSTPAANTPVPTQPTATSAAQSTPPPPPTPESTSTPPPAYTGNLLISIMERIR